MAIAQHPNVGATYRIDWRVVGLATVASVVGRAVSSAFGGGLWATNVCTLVLPAITAFVTVPVPRSIHRARRVALVLALAGVVTACRRALAATLTRIHVPRSQRRDLTTEAGATRSPGVGHDGIGSATAPLTHAWLGQVALTTVISLAPVAGAVAAHNALRAPAASASGPTLHAPDGVIAHAGNHATARVTYVVTATGDDDKPLVPTCHPSSGALFTLGKTNVSCSATDATGKHANAQFAVTVSRGGHPRPPDRTPPTLAVPADFSREATSANGARVTYWASARDDRDGALTPVCRPISGSVFRLGRTRVTCTATNIVGRTTRRKFVVTVTARTSKLERKRSVSKIASPIKTPATGKARAKVQHSSGNNAKPNTPTVTVTPEPPPPSNGESQGTDQSSATTPLPAPKSAPSLAGDWQMDYTLPSDTQPRHFAITLQLGNDPHCPNAPSPCYISPWYALSASPHPEGTFFVVADTSGSLTGITPDSDLSTPQYYNAHLTSSDPPRYDGNMTQEVPGSSKPRTATFVLTRCSTATPDPPIGC